MTRKAWLLSLLALALHAAPGRWQPAATLKGDVTLPGEARPLKGRGRVWVYLPAGYDPARKAPLLLALHGWNHSPEFWRSRSCIAALADRYGVVLACPEMGRTVYETRFFPETRQAWSTVPGTPWLLQVVLPWARRTFGVSQDAARTGILGYSTGGRGAIMAVEHGGAFGFCASLSGTYDLPALDPKTGEYRIHAFVYGERKAFPKRWEEESSLDPAFAPRFKDTFVFVAHGGRDPVVDPAQARALEAWFGLHHIACRVEISPEGGHDWAFWNAELAAAFQEMEKRARGAR